MFPATLKSLPLVVVIAIALSSGITPLYAKSAAPGSSTPFDFQEGVRKRAVEDEHDHSHAETESQSDCAVTDHVLAHEFTELAEELSLTDVDGEVCHVEEEEGEEHGHMEEHGDEEHNVTSNFTCSSCDAIYGFVKKLLVRLNVTAPCCLDNETACPMQPNPEIPVGRTDPAKAYGYGFLMVVLVSACSLLGVLLLPLLNKQNKFHGLYKYFYALMIALGTSALFCDAILHLIPEAFGLHDHAPGEESHAHEEEEEEDKSFIWKGIIVIAALYLFYLFEVALHSWNSHTHHHHYHHHQVEELDSNSGSETRDDSSSCFSRQPLKNGPASCKAIEPTIPHGACRDKCPEDAETGGGSLHPRHTSCSCEETSSTTDGDVKVVTKKSNRRGCRGYLDKIKPLAWVIIFGDAIHNFADGLALGAAISQSLSLGVSTMIAIVFHELPHELGDFAILLSTGLKWYTALLFNFASSLTAVLGFFVGVAIGTSTSEANGWILAAAAGVFLYIALVDLLPELIHVNEKGRTRIGLFVMANIGFFISFIVLLLIAVYEDQLNTLITVAE